MFFYLNSSRNFVYIIQTYHRLISMRKINIAILSSIVAGFVMCQGDTNATTSNTPTTTLNMDSIRQEEENMELWVEQQLKTMNDDQRLGQLLMLGAYPMSGVEDESRVLQAIQKFHIGGVIFFKTHPTRLVHLINKYQSKSKLPLLVGIDGEWGANMRVDSTIQYPRQLTLGAIRDNSLIYRFGTQVARECKRLGIHINFAPTVDINNNAANPVIGDRSFGDNILNVSEKATQYMLGMQDNGILACAKHFPGHGDTNVDSHHDLPVLNHSRARLDSLELAPFRYLIQRGVASIMVGHLQIPALDTTPHVPATLSRNIVQKLLKEELNYKGLVITDALNMKGVTKHFQHGETDVLALLAGNDILLMTQNLDTALVKIKQAIADKKVTWDDINERVRKVLRAKYKAGLHAYKPIDPKGLTTDLQTAEAERLREDLLSKSLTLLNNPKRLLPLLNTSNVATIAIGEAVKTPFQSELDKFGITTHYHAGHTIIGKQADKYKGLEKAGVAVVAIHNITKLPTDDHNISASVREFVAHLNTKTNVVVVLFGTPYAAKFFDTIPTVAIGYTDQTQVQQLMAQALVGAIGFEGQLPVQASPALPFGTGVTTQPVRLPYATRPEVVGLKSSVLAKMDKIAQEMIKEKAAPGCQVIVVKDGRIALHKTYGYHTYERTQAVRSTDVYDLASVTKIAAATLSIMKLSEQGKIDINKPLSDYLTDLKGTNKEGLSIKEIMAHQAGLKPWIPFYTQTLDSTKRPHNQFYKIKAEGEYCVRVSEQMYFCRTATDSVVWRRIYDAPQEASKEYKYSDLGFYMFARLVEQVSGKPIDKYVEETFYRPMGLTQIGYNPLQRGIAKQRIVPTEQDKYFRYGTVHGDVHDMGAAMLGGVSGHAGLFSTATDLAAIMQLFLNEGTLFGKRYLDSTTVRQFITPYSKESRRAIGFDRKEDGGTKSINVAYQASARTFGHLGFTGIGAWADPDNQIVYIFLSNRTYPDSENNKLNSRNIRPRMHEVIYEAMMK